MRFHEVADIFPMMSSEEYESLKTDIKQNGLLQPIWTFEDQIIDGRNRYNACKDIGITPTYKTWDGNGNLIAFVVSLNLQRRHLNSSQKAFVALEVERLLAEEARERQREAQIEAGKNFGRGMNRDDRSSQNFDFTYPDETVSQKFQQREEFKTTGQRVVDDLEKLIEDEMVGPVIAAMAREKALEQIDDPDLTATGCLLLASDEYQYGTSNYDNRPNFLNTEGVFIEEKNKIDKHISSDQKAIIALETEKKLTNINKSHHNDNKATEQAAKIVGSNRQYISDAKSIQKASPEVAKAVVSGAINIPDAKKIATLPESQRQVVLQKVEAGEKPTKAIQDVKREEIKQHLESVEVKAVKELEGVFDVIVIDPPWPMQKIERDVAPMQTQFDYPVMSIDEIKTMNIPAADSCHVFLWTTHKFLPDAFDIVKQWGFKYIFQMTWVKNGGFQPFNLPQYTTEMVLYCRKGTPEFLDTKNFRTHIIADRGKHSEKPEEFYQLLRRITAGRRLDMFNRRSIDGFEGWGKEAAISG